MISTLRGILVLKHANVIVIETNGVGYEVIVPLSIIDKLPVEGEKVFLHIHTYVKDNNIELYGFLTKEEKEVFQLLLSINGIGPKIALNILSAITTNEFYQAVEKEDILFLSKLPGIGNKTAKRIIFELKQTLPVVKAEIETVYNDALSALVNLGYKKSIAKEALDKVYCSDKNNIEILIKESLRHLKIN